METGVFRFQIGALECWSISDGTALFTTRAFFANAPQDQYQDMLAKYGLSERTATPLNCLLIHDHQQFILVDTGMGWRGPTGTGHLLANLAQVGVAPEQIDLVVLSHGHADHMGGVVAADAGAPVRAAFPNARYCLTAVEHAFWQSDAAVPQLGLAAVLTARESLRILGDQLRLISQFAELAPGIRAMPSPGHTPGNISLQISSGGEQLLYIADVIAHPLHLEKLDWIISVDISPDQAAASRREVVEYAADNGHVLGYHLPFPGLGKIKTDGDGYYWQPKI